MSNEAKDSEQQSFIEQQTAYWKAFIHDLFLGTLKRMIAAPLVFSLAFVVVAYMIYTVSIKPQSMFVLLKIVEALLLYLLYLVIGFVAGVFYGANTTLLRKIDELERGVHLIVDALMTLILNALPGGDREIGVDEFNALLDTEIWRFKKASRRQFRWLSVVGAFSRFFVRLVLRILRRIFLHEFLEDLEEEGETQINAKTVEAFYRTKLVGDVVDVFTGRLVLIQHGIYGVLAVFLLLPILLVGLSVLL